MNKPPQPELFPDRKPRKWTMLEALGVLEWFLAEADRLGMTEPERTQWARARTWEKVEAPEGREF